MILAPETSSLTATDGASLSSRVRVSETLASRNSTVPPTAPTQSQQDTIDILDRDSFSSSFQLFPVQTESMRFSSSATSVESQRSEKAEKFQSYQGGGRGRYVWVCQYQIEQDKIQARL